jgi:hypothetical protein
MKTRVSGLILALTLLPVAVAPAQAQLMDQLKGAVGNVTGGGQAGGAGLPSVNQASPSNVAGVLQYCMKNNYLSGNAASSVQNSLLSNGNAKHDSSFTSGSNGVLQSGNGQGFSLGGGGIKQQVTQKVCDMVLQHGKSLLGAG